MKKELVIALDAKGHKVVVMNEILFYGKKNLPWDKVEQYLKRYIGKVVTVADVRKFMSDRIFRMSIRGRRIPLRQEELTRKQRQMLYRVSKK